MTDEQIKRLVELRNEWSTKAAALEETHGDADPGAKAFRVCVSDVWNVIHWGES